MTYVYVDPGLRSGGVLSDPQLPQFTERHYYRLPPVHLAEIGGIERLIETDETLGVIFGLTSGLANRRVLALARYALRCQKSAFLYWPTEDAIEVLDRERIGSFSRHRLAYIIGMRLMSWRQRRAQRTVSASAGMRLLSWRWRRAQRTVSASAGIRLLSWRWRRAQRTVSASDEPMKFIVADFATTKTHLLGGIDDLRRLASRIASHHEALRQLGYDAAAIEPLRQLADDAGAMSTAAAQLVTHIDGTEVALSRIETDLGQLSTTFEQLLKPAAAPSSAAPQVLRAAKEYQTALHAFAGTILPVPFPRLTAAPSVESKIPGRGVYIRTDYWAQLISGGSYGHTCYVAHELARVTDDFVCLLGSRFPLLDELGVAQEVVRPPLRTSTATDLLQANSYYYAALRERLGKLRPAYVFERLVLGNYAVARLCRELEIPYLVEYNGSEISMRHSFGAGAVEHEDLFIEAERVAFKQATAITAISDHVRDDIVRRGIVGDKIVVNPNGVNCSEYAPPTAEEKRDLRAVFGFAPEHRVIGFIGTFGGWHGIDVLAAAMPEICRRAPEVRFLLIGDGNLKHLVTDAIRHNKLEQQVVDVGRTDQRLGARYMRAADIFVSPHSSHMRDSKFFGSPTKLFEYMALGGGIVASDLEQIGVTLAPALRPVDFARGPPKVGLERAVLCKPGDVDELVAGVLALVWHANIAAALGANARAAAREHFSWERHVARIWDHVLGLRRERAWR
jgi:glycosyltransferase involved in cell wall biosynthesis